MAEIYGMRGVAPFIFGWMLLGLFLVGTMKASSWTFFGYVWGGSILGAVALFFVGVVLSLKQPVYAPNWIYGGIGAGGFVGLAKFTWDYRKGALKEEETFPSLLAVILVFVLPITALYALRGNAEGALDDCLDEVKNATRRATGGRSTKVSPEDLKDCMARSGFEPVERGADPSSKENWRIRRRE